MDDEVLPAHWQDDVLGRRELGDFLYQLCTAQYGAYHSRPDSGALCVAIDADWGAGKSFFVKRWRKDVEEKRHPVIYFDAWLNDLSDDPLIGFMAQLQSELEPWLERLPSTEMVLKKGRDKLGEVLKAAPRAVLPVLSVLGKSVLKKVAALDTDDLAEAVSGSIPVDGGDVAELGTEALTKFFEVTLKSHTGKQLAIKALQAAIADLLGFLETEGSAKLPLFIFVDELDRCRPDYAVRLLEGIKHLFNAHGVCFVFSTNLAQLAASTKAVYGSDFDGYRYLKRLFAFEYRLPAPDYLQFGALLVRDSLMARRHSRFVSGLPAADESEDASVAIARSFAAIADAFNLDLRTQKQVFRLADAACSQIQQGRRIHCLFLFALAVLRFKSPSLIDDYISGRGDLRESLQAARKPDFTYSYYDRKSDSDRRADVAVGDVLLAYAELARQSGAELLASWNQTGRALGYFDSIIQQVVAEFTAPGARRDERSSLFSYGDAVRLASLVT